MKIRKAGRFYAAALWSAITVGADRPMTISLFIKKFLANKIKCVTIKGSSKRDFELPFFGIRLRVPKGITVRNGVAFGYVGMAEGFDSRHC